jgi:hypothetical protein
VTGVQGSEANENEVLAESGAGERTGVCTGGRGKAAMVNASGLAERDREPYDLYESYECSEGRGEEEEVNENLEGE